MPNFIIQITNEKMFIIFPYINLFEVFICIIVIVIKFKLHYILNST